MHVNFPEILENHATVLYNYSAPNQERKTFGYHSSAWHTH